jgi:small redox-active disulfide protein 2
MVFVTHAGNRICSTAGFSATRSRQSMRSEFRSPLSEEIDMSTEIKVLGIGCSNCTRLCAEAEKAIRQAGVAATLTKAETIEEIAAYKILATPALVIDGIVKSAGRIPDTGEIVSWIINAIAKQDPAQ